MLTTPHLNGIAGRDCGFFYPGLEKLIHKKIQAGDVKIERLRG
jgi:hypothetical protein